MPQIVVMIAPDAQERVNPEIHALGLVLIADVEETFGLQGKHAVAFSALNLAYAIGEADVQVEIRYTANKDGHKKETPFDSFEREKKKLVEMISETLRKILNGIVDSASVRITPMRKSELSKVHIYPKGFIGIDSAPEEVKLSVMWGSPPVEPEFGKAIKMGEIWYIQSDRNPHADGRVCVEPVAWHTEEQIT